MTSIAWLNAGILFGLGSLLFIFVALFDFDSLEKSKNKEDDSHDKR